MYAFTSDWLGSWFPLLPSYTAFVMRVNRLGEAFRRLLAILLNDYAPDSVSKSSCMIDSMRPAKLTTKKSKA